MVSEYTFANKGDLAQVSQPNAGDLHHQPQTIGERMPQQLADHKGGMQAIEKQVDQLVKERLMQFEYQRTMQQRTMPYGYPGDFGGFADPYFQQRPDPSNVLRGVREPPSMLYAQQQYQIPRKNQEYSQYRAANESAAIRPSVDLPYTFNSSRLNPGLDQGFQNAPNKDEAIKMYTQHLQNLQQKILE